LFFTEIDIKGKTGIGNPLFEKKKKPRNCAFKSALHQLRSFHFEQSRSSSRVQADCLDDGGVFVFFFFFFFFCFNGMEADAMFKRSSKGHGKFTNGRFQNCLINGSRRNPAFRKREKKKGVRGIGRSRMVTLSSLC